VAKSANTAGRQVGGESRSNSYETLWRIYLAGKYENARDVPPDKQSEVRRPSKTLGEFGAASVAVVPGYFEDAQPLCLDVTYAPVLAWLVSCTICEFRMRSSCDDASRHRGGIQMSMCGDTLTTRGSWYRWATAHRRNCG
jgi:hypothetical protein